MTETIQVPRERLERLVELSKQDEYEMSIGSTARILGFTESAKFLLNNHE